MNMVEIYLGSTTSNDSFEHWLRSVVNHIQNQNQSFADTNQSSEFAFCKAIVDRYGGGTSFGFASTSI